MKSIFDRIDRFFYKIHVKDFIRNSNIVRCSYQAESYLNINEQFYSMPSNVYESSAIVEAIREALIYMCY